MDPQLLSMLACSAQHVASTTTLPQWVDPVGSEGHPQVFYYGTQGTSTIWSDNKAYPEKTHKAFHEIDKDGDWDSALVATPWHVPFIEVSITTIACSRIHSATWDACRACRRTEAACQRWRGAVPADTTS